VVLQSLLLQFSSVGVHKSNLLETRVVTTDNHHGRFLSPELLWLVSTTEVYSGLGADIVMKSISLTTGSLAKSPSMRRPISVKSDFVRSLILPGLGAASAAILPSALFGERFFARCQLGVLVSVGAAT
jgi:hypothetical protein